MEWKVETGYDHKRQPYISVGDDLFCPIPELLKAVVDVYKRDNAELNRLLNKMPPEMLEALKESDKVFLTEIKTYIRSDKKF